MKCANILIQKNEKEEEVKHQYLIQNILNIFNDISVVNFTIE